MKTLRRIWIDREGIVVSTELVLLATVLAIGVLVGLVALRYQVTQELADAARAVGTANQSHSFSGLQGHTSRTAGSNFRDLSEPFGLTVKPPSEEGGGGGGGGGGESPRTQGFWKNHEDQWPVDSLTLGDETYSKQEALDILNTPVQGDASLILAHQLIATKLNLANSVDGSSIADAVSTGDSLLSGQSGKLPYDISPSSSLGQEMVETAGALDNFNNGN